MPRKPSERTAARSGGRDQGNPGGENPVSRTRLQAQGPPLLLDRDPVRPHRAGVHAPALRAPVRVPAPGQEHDHAQDQRRDRGRPEELALDLGTRQATPDPGAEARSGGRGLLLGRERHRAQGPARDPAPGGRGSGSGAHRRCSK